MVMYCHTVQIYLISLGKKLLQSLTSKHIDQEFLVSLLKADFYIGVWPTQSCGLVYFYSFKSANTGSWFELIGMSALHWHHFRKVLKSDVQLPKNG